MLSVWLFCTDGDNIETAGARRGHLSSYLPIPPAHNNSDIYLQMCIWDDNGIILITAHVTEVIYTTDEIYRALGFSVLLNVNCILTYWINASNYDSNFLQTRRGFKLASTITVLSQTKKKKKTGTRVASKPIFWVISSYFWWKS